MNGYHHTQYNGLACICLSGVKGPEITESWFLLDVLEMKRPDFLDAGNCTFLVFVYHFADYFLNCQPIME